MGINDKYKRYAVILMILMILLISWHTDKGIEGNKYKVQIRDGDKLVYDTEQTMKEIKEYSDYTIYEALGTEYIVENNGSITVVHLDNSEHNEWYADGKITKMCN